MDRLELWKRLAFGESLGRRAVRAVAWAFGLRIASQLLGLVRTMILARLLSPDDFGVFGIALVSISTLNTLSFTGFEAALVQKKEDVKPYLSTAWTIQVLRGLVLAGLVMAAAKPASMFFGEPRAVPALRALSFVVFFRGLSNIGIVYFRKELEFRKYFAYEVSGTLADTAIAIPMAYLFRNVWALVVAIIGRQLVQMVVSYVLHSYRPSPRVDGQYLKDLFRFGKWVSGSSILLFLLNEGDDVLVGKMLGSSSLGLYQMAYRISNLPATEITHVTSLVTFPTYAKLQDQIPRLRAAFLRTLRLNAFLAFPIAGGVFVLAPGFVRLFLGEQWMPIGASTGPVFQAMGRPELLTKLVAVKLLCLGVLIYPMTRAWGITGTSGAVVIAALLVNPVTSYVVVKITECSAKEFLLALAYPLMGTLTMVGLVLAASGSFASSIQLAQFLLLVLIGTAAYVAAVLAMSRALNYGFVDDIKKLINV
jgi:lipopolysaccharide exporter